MYSSDGKAFSLVILKKVFGAQPPSQAAFEALMAYKLPLAAGNHGLWSGYFEIFSGLSDNLQNPGKVLKDYYSGILYLAIPLSYLASLCAVVVFKSVLIDKRLACLLVLTIIFPISISLVAGDYFRWICMSANLALLAILTLQANGCMQAKSPQLLFILLFSLLAPFGAAELSHPFPMHQFLFDRIIG